MRWYYIVRWALAMVACLGGCFVAIRDLRISLSERAPTQFKVENFEKQYHGQQWISVDGFMDTERAVINASTSEYHEGKDLVYVTAPIVPPNWKPDEPVHVVLIAGPYSSAEAKSRLAAAGGQRQSFTGKIAPSGLDNSRVLPGLKLVEPVVHINNGTTPGSVLPMVFFLVLMVVLVGVFGWLLVRNILNR